MFCGKCGKAVSPDLDFCVHCGARVGATNSDPQVTSSAAAPKVGAGASDEMLWRAYVGKNSAYYVPRFAKYAETSSTFPSWHWPAFFVAFWWALYRNAWGAAILFFFLPWLLFIPFAIVTAVLGDDNGFTTARTILFYALAYVVPATLANGIYFRLAQKRVAEARALSPDTTAQIAYLSGKGGTSSVFVIVLALFVVVFLSGILAAIAIPAYQDYITRSKISEALVTGVAAENYVATYWKDNGTLPTPSDVAAFVNSVPHPYVVRIDLDPKNGVLTLTLSNSIGPPAGKSLQLTPSEDANGQVTWRCSRGEIPAKYLPASCRGE